MAVEELRAGATPEAPSIAPQDLAELRASREKLSSALRDRDAEIDALRARARSLEAAAAARPAVVTSEEAPDAVAAEVVAWCRRVLPAG